jgi:protein-disulfide isomerase
MPPTLFRSLAAIAGFSVLAACSHSDASAHTAQSSATTATANGALASPAMPHDSITDAADRGRIAGDSTASLWVIMASDFECPYCKEWHDQYFAPIMRDYAEKGKIRLAFVNMPLSMHQNAIPAAEAAMCASAQNKFWPVHDALFASQSQWESLPDPVAKFDSLVAAAGVDPSRWRACMKNHSTLPLVKADHDKLRGAGVNSTPTFFVDGKMLVNQNGESAGVAADVRGAIDAALKARGKS